LVLTSLPEFVQYAALEALKCEEEPREYADCIKERLRTACSVLNEMSIPHYEPDGSFYIFPKVKSPKGVDPKDFALRLLMEKRVCVAPGTAFGDYPEFIRISANQPDEIMREGIKRIGELSDRK
jgi:aspartate aminotransferase